MKKPKPQDFKVQLATLKDLPPEGNDWIHEVKLDGYRALAMKLGQKVFMLTRSGNDWTETYLELATDLKKLPFDNIVLDGEICALDSKGVTSFQKMQTTVGRNSLKKDVRGLAFYAFDLLYFEDTDYRGLPLLERKKKLKSLSKAFSKRFIYSKDFEIHDAEKALRDFCRSNLEGIVSKRKTSIYQGKRNEDWIKSKCQKNDEFVVIGYLPGASQPFGALLLGEYVGGELRYAGKVGTGFKATMKKDFFEKIQSLLSLRPPVKEVPKGLKAAVWIKPKLVAEINFLTKSSQGFRHASFKTFRTDKTIKDLK